MKQSEQNAEAKTSIQQKAGQSKKSQNSSKGSLQKQEKDLLSQIISQDLHKNPQFSANFGLSNKQCQSQNVENIFKGAFIKFYNQYRNDKNFLAYFYDKLDQWFRPAKIMPGAPKEFYDSIILGVTLLISHQLLVVSENPQTNFRALIEQKLKKYLTFACQALDIKTKDQLEIIYQEFVQNPSEGVFEFISGISDVQFMIHTDYFPSSEVIIYAKGQRLSVSQIPDIKRKFFHIIYSQKYQSFYDLCLQQKDCQLANNLPFINEKLKVFREDCDDVIKFQLEFMKNKPKPDNQLQITREQFLDQLFLKYKKQIDESQQQSNNDYNEIDQSEQQSEQARVNEKKIKKNQQQIIVEQVQPKMIQIIQQRFAQNKEEIHQMEQNLMKEQIDNTKTPYCILYSFYELCQMTQKEIIKRLASYYRISLKQFSNPCYLVGLLMLSFQYIDKKQNTSTFDSTQSSLMGFAIYINQFKSKGVVHGSILGYQIVNQIQLPKYFAYILKDMLGQQAIVDEKNPLRVFICPQCLCFDRFDHHDCQE